MSTPARVLRNIVFEAPDPERLAAFYAELVELEYLRRPPDWLVIGRDGTFPRLAFDPTRPDYIPPRWGDPDRPSQLRPELTVPDRERTRAWLPTRGATSLSAGSNDQDVWADPAGHPFWLTENPSHRPRIAAVVVEAEAAVSLAAFYTELFDLHHGADEPPHRLSIRDDLPRLGFVTVPGHRQPRWPDPAYPQQLHLDFQVADQSALMEHAQRLGATRLPEMGGDAPVFADPAGHPFCLCPSYTPTIVAAYAASWHPWRSTIEAIDPAVVQTPGVDGDRTLIDVVSEVHAAAWDRLEQLRAAFDDEAHVHSGHRGPSTAEIAWAQLVAEAGHIQDASVDWLQRLDEALLDTRVGWVETEHGPRLRLLGQEPEAHDPLPIWRFIQLDQTSGQLEPRLNQIRDWLTRHH